MTWDIKNSFRKAKLLCNNDSRTKKTLRSAFYNTSIRFICNCNTLVKSKLRHCTLQQACTMILLWHKRVYHWSCKCATVQNRNKSEKTIQRISTNNDQYRRNTPVDLDFFSGRRPTCSNAAITRRFAHNSKRNLTRIVLSQMSATNATSIQSTNHPCCMLTSTSPAT